MKLHRGQDRVFDNVFDRSNHDNGNGNGNENKTVMQCEVGYLARRAQEDRARRDVVAVHQQVTDLYDVQTEIVMTLSCTSAHAHTAAQWFILLKLTGEY